MLNRTNNVLFKISLTYLIFFSILIMPIKVSNGIDVTPNTIVEVNDVVQLNYTLWVDNKIDDIQNGTVYVHDPIDSTVPNEIYETFPDIHAPPNLGFMQALLGMKAGESKTVDIPFNSGLAFTNLSDRLYGKDLFYQIYLEKILLDASTLPPTLFDLPFFIPIVFFTTLLIISLIGLRIKRYSSTRNIFGFKKRCKSCNRLANVQCGNLACNTPYCKDCFIKNSGCSVCRSNSMVPLK